MKVVYDVETKYAFGEQGRGRPQDLEISFVGALRSDTGELLSYWEDDLPKLFELFHEADEIIGFNSHGFDHLALLPYYKGNIFKLPSLDLLEIVHTSLGRRISLDKLAHATLGKGKIGHGLDAIKYWRKGEYDKLEKYCLEDVKITWDIHNFAKEMGHLYYLDGVDNKVKFDINWPEPEPEPEQVGLGI